MEYINGENTSVATPNGEGGDQPQDGDYSDAFQSAYMPHNEFEFVNYVMGDGIHKKEMGITTLAFDTHEELLWSGTKSGHVTSYYSTSLQKYTSFQVHPTDEVRHIVTLDHGIFALTPTSLRSQMRRGIPIYTHSSENMIDLHSVLVNNHNGRLLMGGMQNKLLEFDPVALKETKKIEVVGRGGDPDSGTCAILRENSRFVVSGDVPAGKIHLRDPHTLEVAHTLDAHTGDLSDFDVHGHHLVTCGHSRRHGGIQQPDRCLVVYDLRILRAISPIHIHLSPYQLRFLPSMSSRIVVVSSMGQVQLVDTATLSTPQVSLFQIDMGMESANAISMDVSPSNQCLAFGDTTNYIHIYSNAVHEPVFNHFVRATEFADEQVPLTHIAIEDEMAVYSSIPRPHLPPGQSQYISDYWPEKFNRKAYRPTPEIDPEILRTMKVVGTVGYARNISNMRRNLVQYPDVIKRWIADSGGRGGDISGSDRGDGSGSVDGGILKSSKVINVNVPKAYRKIGVKFSKMGTDDFDFDRFNRTGFCGLEASLPNSYSNSMLQILYYTEKLRILVLNHTCTRENCVCCELSFLFHMMDISPGMPCQSSNFLRCLRTIPEASALGLVFTEQNAVWNANVPRVLQSWDRFILHQIHVQMTTFNGHLGVATASGKRSSQSGVTRGLSSPMKTAKPSTQTELEDISREISAAFDPKLKQEKDRQSVSTFVNLFGIQQEKVNVCTRCKESKSHQDVLLLCNLIYPELSRDPSSNREEQKKDFSEIVCSSLCPEQTTPAWCDKCRKYQTTIQTRNIMSLPHTLTLNAGMDNPQDIGFWQTQLELAYADHMKLKNEKVGGSDTLKQQPPSNIKACRYGAGCTRPDCKFWHPDLNPNIQINVDVGVKCAQAGVSWIPLNMVLHRHKDGSVSQGSNNQDVEDDSPIVETKHYELYGVCYVVLDPSSGQAHNIVAAINVGPTYHARVASPVSQWYVFNDFSINIIRPEESVVVDLSWKIPAVLFYQTTTDVVSPDLSSLCFKNPITFDVFSEDQSLSQRSGANRKRMITFVPLRSPDEMPTHVAIDAEFVTLNQEESELRSDGKVSTVKAAQMSVARITCVRGSGPLEGTPFIDDYISTQEQVVDYVTKFSGIKPGDLDANFSQKHLTTLKSTYLKLRYLVDMGCIFIGHGLKNDFKVINIVVPPDQVIDTVHLFHLPHHRMISLKFLAWHFLKRNIQGHVHDSIEDAVTALALYRKYLQLERDNVRIEALNELYEHGKEVNWKTPQDFATNE